MRILIIFLLISSVAFGQTVNKKINKADIVNIGDKGVEVKAKPNLDTINAKLISILEVQQYLLSINRKLQAVKELNLSKDEEYNQMVIELNRIIGELEKKKKLFK